ncbi:hypothetical protein GO308_14195 [Sphingomonas sp. SFZ2018-12]|uniref:CmcJ/NvfI family oxidoreductase n=1 Tax=Sphingomonas sp. SFZ2018-12 TaxID=2683197 RepID=UPI001F0FAFF0|nr:hypothetical protein [Sphingomonas sp. SFZ2018-12]
MTSAANITSATVSNSDAFPGTTARLNGLFPATFDSTDPVEIDPRVGPHSSMIEDDPAEVSVINARPLQARSVSEAAFFEAYGFALLPHKTTVSDWAAAADARSPEATERYFPEIEALVRERLLPGVSVELQQWWGPVQRGRGTAAPDYINAVHSDYGLTPQEFEDNLLAYGGRDMAERWRRRFERDDVEAFMMIDFWRPTTMSEPLRHMPLALCDPRSVEPADLVSTLIWGISPSDLPAFQVLLRYNAAQKWHYYPQMEVDEVLAFKQFEYRKGDPAPPPWRSVFHSAFEDPDTPADAQPRQSSEHRVGVLVLRN